MKTVLQESLEHDQTILYDRPSEVAPHALAIQEGFRSSDDRLLASDKKQKRLDLILNCVNSILQALHKKELEEELLQCHRKRYGSE